MSNKNHRGGTNLNPNAHPFQAGMSPLSGDGNPSYADHNGHGGYPMMNASGGNVGNYGPVPQYESGSYNRPLRGGRFNPSYNMNPQQQQGYSSFGPAHPADTAYNNTPQVGRPPMVGGLRGGDLPMNMGMGGMMDRTKAHNLMQGGAYNMPHQQQQIGNYGGYRGTMPVGPTPGYASSNPMRNPTPPPLHPIVANPQPSPMPPTPPFKENPSVIMVTGYRKTGKTTVAKELAKLWQYEYISLKNPTPENGGDAEEDDSIPILNSSRFAPLTRVLERKHSIKGLVIDDALVRSKYEPYHVNFLLEKAGLHLDILVIITIELSDLLRRGVLLESAKQMQAHPESFEFGEQLEEANNSDKGAPIAVVDGTGSLEAVVNEAIKQVNDLEARGLRPLRLPNVEFISNCPLVTDPALVEAILAAETAALGLETLPYGFPYVEPNYLMGYLEFVRNALLFKHYMVVPWIWGDKISLIGYDDAVYVHLPSYRVLFHLQDVPPLLWELMSRLAVELSGEAQAAPNGKVCLFSLEASMLDNVIYICDMMSLGKRVGSKTLLPERVKLLKESLGKLPVSGPIRLLEHFSVNEIQKCMEAYAGIARGVLFVNPDGMKAGFYESRNFIYPCEEKKTVKIRVWEGRLEENSATWSFDAYARDNEGEVCITNLEDMHIPVYISDEQVCEHTINDGNIVECVLEQMAPSSPPRGGKKGNKGQPTSHFAFRKRCKWQVEPTTLYYQSAFVSKPAWATNLFLDACGTIPYKEAKVITVEE